MVQPPLESSGDEVVVYTPVDVLRELTRMGVIVNAVTVWTRLRRRLAEEFPERAEAAAPDALPLDAFTFFEWIEDFVDEAEAARAKLTRSPRRQEPE
jgi:hypothetical protein